jgi:hypothetical protein
MARLIPPTLTELAAFTGQTEESYSDFITTALSQATILFELATGLDTYPDAGTPNYDLSQNAICEMADALYLRLPFRKVVNSPFSSESIGSYSYSKLTPLVAQGIPTGLGWFDMAVQLLAIDGPSVGVVSWTSVSAFENDQTIVRNSADHLELVGPEDVDLGYPMGGTQS